MTRLEIYQDLLRRQFYLAEAAAREEGRDHEQSLEMYERGLEAFTYPTTGVVARAWDKDMDHNVNQLFQSAYDELNSILRRGDLSNERAQQLVAGALRVMARFFEPQYIARD